MGQLYELRIELTQTEAEQAHIAVFATDKDGAWFLVDDWTADNPAETAHAVEEAVTMVDSWLTFGGRLLPA